MHHQFTVQDDLKNKGWLFNPVMDLLFACGGLFWLLVLIHISLVWALGRKVVDFPFEMALLFLGNVVLSNAHISSTLLRLYGDRVVRKRLWYHSYLTALIFAVLMLASCCNPIVFTVAILLYLSFQIDHVNSQNYGVSLLYCYRAGFILSAPEKAMFKVVHHALGWYAILRTMTYPAFIPQSGFGIELPMLGPLPELVVNISGAVLLCSLISFFVLLIKRSKNSEISMPLPAAVLFLTNLLMFTAPIGFAQVFYLFGSTFFHSVQYVLVSAFYKQREQQLLSFEKSLLGSQLRYFVSVTLVSSLFIAILPFVLSKLFALAYDKSWVIVLVSVSLHHFLADRELWKFKDQHNQAILLNDVHEMASVG